MSSQVITYVEILELARKLEPTLQLRLLEELAVSLRQSIPPQPLRRILELQGLGKDVWQNIDAQTYVRQERAAWGG